jgi:hypothetical protein
MGAFMKRILFCFVSLIVSTSFAAVYDCEAILGYSEYDSEAIKAKIENFDITNLGAMAGDVIIGDYRFSFYQYDRKNGNAHIMIAKAQPGNEVTPYLSKASADVVPPAKGQTVSVSLDGIGSLTCTGF